MTHWYYSARNKKEGPISEADLIDKIREGTLKNGALVWKQGLKVWQPVESHFSEYFDQIHPLSIASHPDQSSEENNKPEINKEFLSVLRKFWGPLAIALIGGAQFFFINDNLNLDDYTVNGLIFILSLSLMIMTSCLLVFHVWTAGHRKQIESTNFKGGGYKLTSVFLGLGLIAFALIYFAQAPAFFRVDKVRKAYDNFTMDVDVVGNKIFINGTIGPSFSSRLQNYLDLYAGINTIIISSPGGLVDQALKVAKIIEQHPEITIIAEKECNSSCIIILMAAKNRYAERNMSFGFHAISLITNLSKADQTLVQLSDEADQYLIKRGVPDEILKYAFGSNEKDLKSVPAIVLADSGAINGLVEKRYPISIEVAKWKAVEDKLELFDRKQEIPLSDFLKTVRESSPEVVKKYADTLYQAYTDADSNKVTDTTRLVLFELVSPAMQSADDKEMYDYIKSNLSQLSHLVNMEQWDTCLNYVSGAGVKEINILSHEGLKEEMSALVSLIKSASRRGWKPHPVPSWVKDRADKIMMENINILIAKGVDLNKFETDKKIKCQYSHLIIKSFVKEGKTSAPALIRWINSTEFLEEDKGKTGISGVVGSYVSDVGTTATTAKIGFSKSGRYTLEYLTATASGCTGEFSGEGQYGDNALIFVNSEYPDCHVSVTTTPSFEKINIDSTEGCRVLSGIRCGIYGHLVRE